MALLFPIYLLTGLGVLWIARATNAAQMLYGLLDACAYIAFIWLVLQVAGKPARFRQTASAVLGTTIWLNLLAMPLQTWHDAVTTSETETSPALFGSLALVIWSIDISGFVLSRALNQPYMVGILIVVLYFVVSLSIATTLPLS